MWSGKDLRANNFDCLRFLMAVLVIFSHSFPLLYGSDAAGEPLERMVGHGMTFGSFAVDVFFIISGFLIAMSFERSPGQWDFLRKRILRIVPGYLAATLIGVFVLAPWFVASPAPWHSLAFYSSLARSMATLGLVTVPGVFYRNPLPDALNGSLWTISYEFKCYLLIVLLGALGILRKRGMVLALFLTIFALYNPHVDSLYPRIGIHHPPLANGTLRFAVYFLAGTVFYLYRRLIPFSNRLAFACAAALPLCCLSASLLNAVLPISLTYLVFWVAFQQKVRVHQFAAKGDFSYGVYLYAFLIQQILVARWPSAFTPWTLFLFSTAGAIVAGYLSWHLVEKRFVGKKVKRTLPAVVVPASAGVEMASTNETAAVDFKHRGAVWPNPMESAAHAAGRAPVGEVLV